ncbi:PPOX class F420-dependent oxidoreductase [Agromyces italicus]|uniref:PPOX class F420-dependent oxidoreductase n=1 Tax=Agromyces italicus TaxID=279572 RepID=UPI0006856C8F|nr:PPOX class F420-dependent oxidoreductase [Agromyces italicus]
MPQTDAPARDAFLALGASPYVRLTTFRRTGVAVHTPVWIVRDGDRLLVTTVAGSGKVKRLSHTERVQLVASDARGVLGVGASGFDAIARVDDTAAVRETLDEALTAKYGDRYREIRTAREARDPASRSTALVIEFTAAAAAG